MALTFQGFSKTDIQTGIVSKIEIAVQSGTPSYLSVGDILSTEITVEGLTIPCDPSGSELTYALRFSVSFQLSQTKKTAELAAMAGTSGTGLFETDVQLKITYLSGRVLTLGSITAYPMRVTMSYTNGTEDGAQLITVSGTTIEPITALDAKVA